MENHHLSREENWSLAKEIAHQLGEKHNGARQQISTIIRVCGIDFARTACRDTLEIEAQGGIMLPDNSRRRTPGGVFFYLVRERLEPEPELKRMVFQRSSSNAPKPEDVKAQESNSHEPAQPASKAEEREPSGKPLPVEGEISTVKITLVGRPGRIELKQDLVTTTMSHTPKTVSLPRGVPQLPSTPTVYRVYISVKQWRKVEEAIAKPEDMLIIEGMCAYDANLQGIAVYTTSVTTKLLEAKRREQQKNFGEASTEGGDQKNPPTDAKSAQKREAKGSTAQRVGTTLPVTPPIRAGMSSDAAQKLSGLYASAALFRQKIAAIQAKPLEQQSGLEMTQKLLKGVEDQIALLEKKEL